MNITGSPRILPKCFAFLSLSLVEVFSFFPIYNIVFISRESDGLTRLAVGGPLVGDELLAGLHIVRVEQELLYAVGQVLLKQVADPDDDEDDDNRDEAQPEGLLQHSFAQRLVRDVRHPGGTVGAWKK